MKLEYPIGFPTDSENVVETEKIRADQDFKLTEQTQTLEQRALRWVCRVLSAFAHQACKLGKEERWTLAEVGAAVDEFCLDLVRKANYLLSDGRLGWVEGVLGNTVRADVRRAIENSEEWRRHCDELLQIAEVQISPTKPRTESASPPLKWEDIELRFLSEERVQIFIRDRPAASVNFADLGFEDRRGKGGKPNRAWRILQELPVCDGTIPASSISGNQRMQKRAQEIRHLLCEHFHITEDPLHFIEGIGYKIRFKITRSPAYDT
jgi:hypothetical protein